MKLKFLVPLLTALALVSLAASAVAQDRYAPLTITVPNVSGDGGISNFTSLNLTMDCRFQPDVALSIKTTSTNTVWRISSSVDNSNYLTNQYVIGVAGPGTIVTNLNVKGIGWLKIDSVLNTGTINSTNTVSYAIKRY